MLWHELWYDDWVTDLFGIPWFQEDHLHPFLLYLHQNQVDLAHPEGKQLTKILKIHLRTISPDMDSKNTTSQVL